MNSRKDKDPPPSSEDPAQLSPFSPFNERLEESVPGFSSAEYSARAFNDGADIRIIMTGNFDMSAVEPTRKFLPRLHTGALARAARSVIVDFRHLEFMNSSCMKSFVSWLNALQQLEPEQQYRVRFVPNPTKYWQRASLVALCGFAVDLVDIEE